MEETSQNLISIGSGANFPIILTDGNNNGKAGWFISEGDINLIKQNLVVYFNTPISSRLREDKFGNKLMGVIEEPNTFILRRLVKDWVSDGIKLWEPRLKVLAIKTNATKIGILIEINAKVGNISVPDFNFYYNPENQQFYVN